MQYSSFVYEEIATITNLLAAWCLLLWGDTEIFWSVTNATTSLKQNFQVNSLNTGMRNISRTAMCNTGPMEGLTVETVGRDWNYQKCPLKFNRGLQ